MYHYSLMEYSLRRLQSSTASKLLRIDVTFPFRDYVEFYPEPVQFFSFITSPKLSIPFPPFTRLAWVNAANVDTRTATYSCSTETTCTIRPPFRIAVFWGKVLHVLGASSRMDTLVLDGLLFDYMAFPVICSPPFGNLRFLEINFRGK
jgi:hypothetical protein